MINEIKMGPIVPNLTLVIYRLVTPFGYYYVDQYQKIPNKVMYPPSIMKRLKWWGWYSGMIRIEMSRVETYPGPTPYLRWQNVYNLPGNYKEPKLDNLSLGELV